MILSRIKKVLLLCILVVPSFFLLSTVHSSDEVPISLKIYPLTFKYEINKGESETGTVYVVNETEKNLTIRSEVEDFLMENEEGNPRFLPEGSGTTSLAKMITISDREFELAPKETKKVKFEIKLPNNAEPGGYYAAVFFKTVPKTAGQNQITVSSRVGSLILVSVPGEISQSGEIVEFTAPNIVTSNSINFLARFKNTGNVHYQLDGNIKITNWFGKEVAQLNLPEHIVLPNSVRRFETKWEEKYLIGKYKADITMQDGEGNIKTSSLIFYAFPLKEFLIILALIFVLFISLMLFKNKFKIVKKEN